MNNKIGWMITNSTKNIGDDFQCLAAKRFIENKDIYKKIDREKMNEYNDEIVKMIINGWYMHEPKNWPPTNNIKPLMISMHISNTKQKNKKVPSHFMLSKENINYMKENGPVGGRDTFTYRMLKRKGIKTYFSGCMTLTLKSRRTTKGEYICLVDPSKELEDFIRSKTNREIVVVRPEGNIWPENYDERLGQAEKLLEVYANAHLLITSRLHGALPTLAMGGNVLLLEHKFGDERFEGLKYLLNIATYKDLFSGKYPLDLDNPLENPKEYLVIRENLEKIAYAFVENKLDEIDFDEINKTNLRTIEIARKRTIEFNKNNKLESIRYREFKNHLRFMFRNIENIIK